LFRAGFLALLLVLGACACSDDDSKPPPHRVPLGVQVTPVGQEGRDPELIETYLSVRQARFDHAQIIVPWAAIEDSAGERDWTSLELHRENVAVEGPSLWLTVPLIDHDVAGLRPAGLEGEPWNAESLNARFLAFLEALAVEAGPRLEGIWIGRDIDAYLRAYPSELRGVIGMLQSCRDAVNGLRPDLLVGTTVSYGEMEQTGTLWIGDSLRAAVEILGLSVFGRNASFAQTQAPAQSVERIRAAAARYANQPIALAEVGFPCFSFEEQASQENFAALLCGYLSDAPEHVHHATWFCLHDYRPADAEAEAARIEPDGGRRDAYIAQLRSLGLRDGAGTARLAWYVIRDWNAG